MTFLRIILILLFLAAPSTASAAVPWTLAPDRETLISPWFAKADSAAHRYWGREPACPAAERRWVLVPHDPNFVATGELGGCVRRISALALSDMSFTFFCQVSAHEYGHLLGFMHTGDVTFVNGSSGDGPTKEQDPYGLMDAGSQMIPQCVVYKFDGRTRSKRRQQDRKWCVKHSEVCARKYPNLAAASLAR